MSEQEAISYFNQIKMPYRWAIGETASHFYAELRDHARIMGNKCQECNIVFLPPRKTCNRCLRPNDKWIEVGPEGTILTHTIVNYHEPLIHHLKPPFAYGLISLDGADTGILHFIGEIEFADLKAGLRVEPVFRKERVGNIMDITHFRPVK